MSSRYGRQKKRKAERAIKNLQVENALLRREKSRSKGLIENCLRVLGSNFVGLPPLTIRSPMSGEFLRVSGASFSQAVDCMRGSQIADNLDYMVHEIGALKSKVMRDELDKAIHFRVSHPQTGEFVYCISREIMEGLPVDVLIKQVSEQIAHQLSASIKSGIQ